MSMSYNYKEVELEPGARPAGDDFIPLSAPVIRGNEWAYIKECLDTGWVSSAGAYVNRFEAAITEHTGIAHAVAVVNGTAALHIALLVAGIAPDDEVLVSDLTFIAPANAMRYLGAWPVFIDAEPAYWQMDPAQVQDFLENRCDWRDGTLRNKQTGRRVRGILPVHILGHPVDMDPILALARKYNLVVIEDATECLGARYKGRVAGHLGDIACFSFNGNKIITTGGGGMVVTDDAAWAARARYYTTQAKDDPLEYIHHDIGYNYRLNNIAAAMGCAQLEHLQDYIAAKHRIAETYTEAFAAVPGISPMVQAPWAESIEWLYTILVDETVFGIDSRALLRALQERGIQSRPLWQSLHLSPAYRDVPQPYEAYPVSERLNRQGLSLPCSVDLQPEAQQRVIETIIASRG